MKYYLLFIVLPLSVLGQNYFQPSGANSWGLANSLVSKSYEQTIFDNPAGLGFLNKNSFFLTYNSGFSLPSLAIKGVGANINFKNLHFGIGGLNYGDDLFSENQISLGAALANEKYSLGFKLAYQGINIQQDMGQSTFLFDFGIMAKLFPYAHFGFAASNLFGANYYKNEALPNIFKLGITILPSSKVQFSLQGDYIEDYQTLLKAGIAYDINDYFQGRIGLTSHVNRYHFGLGFEKKGVQVDFAISSDVNLGLRQHLSLSYIFNHTKQ